MTPCQYIQNRAVDASPVSDRVVLYEPQSRRAIVLNPTGTWLWSFLKSPCTAEILREKLQARFPDLDETQAARDVEVYLRELSEQKLISTA